MAEPQPQAERPPDDTARPRPDALAVNGAVPPPTDETPTIISKHVPAVVRTESGLAESLRGRHLAHFELLEPIGVGGMAAVIRARDTQLDRIVALKVLPPEMAADPEHVRRFQQEARSAAKLDHENIARVFYGGQDQGLLFIAFEFVEGQNLRTLLERRGRLPVPEALSYVLQIATGLAHAAERGVVHRDIKPSNILITPSGRAKLVDMGLARSLGPRTDGGLTQSGVTLGTFDYISPEQALEPRDADVRSDIYSLGCTLYHMLTGHPPVPEGTAAKKLHHHQQVPPIDPRQLNPVIPDEVAAVLGRMMAKDPAERYQQPEQLVQHLLVLAQKVGAPAAGPDGLLFVDAPLPSAPQMRPAFLMGAAVVVLVAFIVFLGTAPDGHGPQRGNTLHPAQRNSGPPPAIPEPGAVVKGGPGAQEKGADSPPQAAPPQEPVWRTFDSAKALADYLDKNTVARVLLGRDLDLEDAPLVFRGRSLEIMAADPKQRPTLRLTYPATGGRTSWAALTIEGEGTVKLTGLRFVVNATQAPDIQMTALAHKGTGQITAIGCEFVQLNAPENGGRGRLSSVTVSGTRGEVDIPRLQLAHCYFAPGQEAVTLVGTTELHAAECAFAPHSAALFHLRGRGRQESKVDLSRCSVFLGEGPAFRLADGPPCTLTATDCLFTRPESNASRPPAALVYQVGLLASSFEYNGNGNAYHNVKLYWARATETGEETSTSLKDFNRARHVTEGDRSTELVESPWQAADPLAALRGQEPQKAFRLRTDVAALRRGDDLGQLVGVNDSAWGQLYPRPLPRPEERTPEAVAGRRVVDPNAKPGSGEYRTLAEAVLAAKSGDDIWIRHTGRLVTGEIKLPAPNFELTIQAAPGSRPLLALNPSPELDEALFRLYDGKLTLKGLAFQLDAPQEGSRRVSVVTLLGPGQCLLHSCLVTLAGSGAAPFPAVMTLADPSTAMKMESRSGRTQPDVDLQNCFIRGEGDLLAVRASRPFTLEVRNSLVVLRAGALLAAEGGSEDVTGQPAVHSMELNQVTAYLGEHLLTLKAARHARGLLKTEVTAQDCLFASAAGGKSLIHLEGMDSENQVRGLLAWASNRANPNVYSNFSPMLDQMPKDQESMLMPLNRQDWLTFTREPPEAALFERVTFPGAPVDGGWTKAAPAQFRAKSESDLSRAGADLDALAKLLENGASVPQPDDD